MTNEKGGYWGLPKRNSKWAWAGRPRLDASKDGRGVDKPERRLGWGKGKPVRAIISGTVMDEAGRNRGGNKKLYMS